MRKNTIAGIALGAVLALLPWLAPADQGHQSHQSHQAHLDSAAAVDTLTNRIDVRAPDVELVNQDNQPGRFLSDFIDDQLVVASFTYTSCTTVCPVLDGIFQRLQTRLADGSGRNIKLLSVSIDPVNDIPARLKAHAEQLGAQANWNFLTGDKDTVTRLLKALEVFSSNILDHPPTVYIVDGEHGIWTRLNGFPAVDQIVGVLDGYRAARTAQLHQ